MTELLIIVGIMVCSGILGYITMLYIERMYDRMLK